MARKKQHNPVPVPNRTTNALVAMNPKQKDYMRSIRDKSITIATGPAGTAKTYIPSRMAAQSGLKMVFCRPAVAGAGEKLGYLPGDLKEKIAPWMLPILDALEEEIGRAGVHRAWESGQIVAQSFEHMRGRSLKNAFIILDEAQNTTPQQMELFVTRMGTGSKVVITGDITGRQSDIFGTSGLADLLLRIPHVPLLRERVGVVQFTRDDIVRSEECQAFVDAYELPNPLIYHGKNEPLRAA